MATQGVAASSGTGSGAANSIGSSPTGESRSASSSNSGAVSSNVTAANGSVGGGPDAATGTGVTGRDTVRRSGEAPTRQREEQAHAAARLEQITREGAEHGLAQQTIDAQIARYQAQLARAFGNADAGRSESLATSGTPAAAASTTSSRSATPLAGPSDANRPSTADQPTGGGAPSAPNPPTDGKPVAATHPTQRPSAAGSTGGSSARRDVAVPASLALYGPRRADNRPMDEQGNAHLVDPNKPIAIDFDRRSQTYNPRAAAIVAQQNALQDGLSLDQARQMGRRSMGYSPTADPGTDGGTWRMAEGPAKGVLYGASMVGAAAHLGYTSARDQADVVAWPNVETGGTGELNGKRHFSQRPGTGVAQGGQGPVQITAPYHDRRGANNPAISAVQAITAGEGTQGGHQARVKDAIIPYNSGVKNDKVGQSEGARGSYASYMQSVVDQMKWLRR